MTRRPLSPVNQINSIFVFQKNVERWIDPSSRRDVQIFNDLCDHSDSCGIEHCEYYDNSPQANKRYLQGLYRSYSMEGMIEDKAYKKHLLEKHAPPNPENSEIDRG